MIQSFLRAKIHQLFSFAVGCCLFLFSISCARLPRRTTPASTEQVGSLASQRLTSAQVNINHAGAAELEKLPGIGPVLAERIVAHRLQYGPFRRAEHLMMVRGFSDHKYRVLRELVTAE